MKTRTKWGIMKEAELSIDVARKNPAVTSEGMAIMKMIKLLIEAVLDIRDGLTKEED